MKKVSKLVTEYILKEIKLGKYGLGDKLPSERELMGILNVGRSSVREALNSLVDMNILEKRMGIGVFIKRTDLSNMVDSYVISALVDTEVSRDLLEFRMMLEVEIAGKAAELAEDEDIIMMENALDMHVDAIHDEASTLNADEAFHKSIVIATKNRILIKVYDFIADLLHSFKHDLLQVEEKKRSLYFHNRIYEAIKSGNEEEARVAMREHLMDITERFERLKEFH